MDCAGPAEWMLSGAIVVGMIAVYAWRHRWALDRVSRREALAWGYLRYDDETLQRLEAVYLEDGGQTHADELAAVRLVIDHRTSIFKA